MHEISKVNSHMHYFLKTLKQKSAVRSKNEEINLKKSLKRIKKLENMCSFRI